MATYFHGGSNNNNNSGSEIQSSAEGLQTLYLLNPNYVPFSDSAQNPTQHNNILFHNPNNNNSTSTSAATHHPHALNLTGLSHAPPQHHLVGVTVPASNIIGSANNSEEISGGFHGFSMAAGAPRVHYNLWGSMDSINDRTPSSAVAAGVTVAATSSSNNSGYVGTMTSSAATTEIGFYRPSSGLQQGLSLSLSSQHPGFRSFSGEMDVVSPASRGGNNNNNNNNGVSSIHSVVLGSKYLKVAQELLDEVVNVGNNKGISIIEGSSSNKEKMKGNIIVESSSVVGDGSSGGGGENNSSGANNNKQGGELSTAQRQELQMKKSKLVNMLDEVEQRYREYHHEMQVVISSFEQAAGYGAARSYTCLALKTISKQFRCLKDAISSQIRGTSKAMGEDDASFLGAKAEGNSSSRLRFVDHHLRQQRALQQLGMIPHHHNAWRPQRGLPERAVSILRAWLFEHFLHPYPKDSDKVMLAKQTGLTRSQVSNWFINARVRLWKPMVEEMYLEEVKDHNNSITTSHDNTNNNIVAQSKSEPFNNQNTTTTTSPTDISNSNTIISSSISPNMGGGGGGGHSGNFLLSPNTSSKPQQNSPSSILSSLDMESSINHSNNNHNNNNNNNNGEANNKKIKFGIIDERNHNNNVIGGYGSFCIEDIGRFNNHHQQQLGPRFHGNGVSLTLGLPPSDHNNNSHLASFSGGTHNQHGGFVSYNNMHLGGNNNNNNSEFCAMNSTTTTPHHPPSSHSGTSYDNIDMQNRKRFAAQLLRDFVA